MLAIKESDKSTDFSPYLALLGRAFATLDEQSAFYVHDSTQWPAFWEAMAQDIFHSEGSILVAHPSKSAAAILSNSDFMDQVHCEACWKFTRPEVAPMLPNVLETWVKQETDFLKFGPFFGVEFLATDPSAMKQGQGAQILDWIINHAKEANRNVFLAAMTPQLVEWYKTKGFEVLHIATWDLVDHTGQPRTAFAGFMGLRLSKTALL